MHDVHLTQRRYRHAAMFNKTPTTHPSLLCDASTSPEMRCLSVYVCISTHTLLQCFMEARKQIRVCTSVYSIHGPYIPMSRQVCRLTWH